MAKVFRETFLNIFDDVYELEFSQAASIELNKQNEVVANVIRGRVK